MIDDTFAVNVRGSILMTREMNTFLIQLLFYKMRIVWFPKFRIE